jgi:hypothetical protein
MERINKPIIQRAGNDAIYGNGSDGDATVNSDVTITDDMYYNNLTITGTGFLRTNGYRVFVKNTLTINSGGQIGIGLTSGNDPTDVPTRTVGGHTTGAISYRIGGQGGGATDPDIPVLPSFLLKDINVLSNGLVFHPTLGIVALQGGSAGTTGAAGATTPALTNSDSWTGKAGAAGSLGSTSNYGNGNPDASTVGVPGGRGSDASPGNATGATPGLGGAGGTGGSGGPVVCVVAKTILGSGSIVALGKKGTVGSAGSSGNPGTQGANGSPAPNNSHHVAPTSHPNPPAHVAPTHSPFTHIPAGTAFGNAHTAPHADHNTHSRYSDFHAHSAKAANHHNPAAHTPAVPKGPAAHHRPAAHHENPHWHHGGGGHHPHNDGPHGGMHHWYSASWHRRYQISHGNGMNHNHVKPNTHATAFVGSGGHHSTDFYHQHAGGTNNNVSVGHAVIPHSHSNHHHVPAPFSRSNHTANPQPPAHVAPTSHANPNQVFPGGAGGVNNGTTAGRAAPAVTGSAGKSGGSGGGGAILVITDSVSGTITYNTSARSATDLDNFSASNGSAYVLIN